jgi:DNA-binding transcriptional LysR family regulator
MALPNEEMESPRMLTRERDNEIPHTQGPSEKGKRERLLADWTPPFSGYHLYYPGRRQPTAAFTLLLEALRYRGTS